VSLLQNVHTGSEAHPLSPVGPGDIFSVVKRKGDAGGHSPGYSDE